jgi:hypothetical protein
MEKALLKSICSQVYQSYPEVDGQSPKIKPQGDNTLLIFSKTTKTADGMPIERSIRVVVNQKGKIAKMTTSR